MAMAGINARAARRARRAGSTGNRPVPSGVLKVFRRDGNGTAFRDDGGRRNHGRRRSLTGDGFLHGKPTNFAYLEHFSMWFFPQQENREAPHQKVLCISYSSVGLLANASEGCVRCTPVGRCARRAAIINAYRHHGRWWVPMQFSGNITAYVGRVPCPNTGSLFMLWNHFYRKLIFVQAVGLDHRLDGDFDQPDLTYVWVEKILPARIAYHSKKKAVGPYRIPCDFLWAPRVDITELEITRLWFLGIGVGRAVWRGKEVDIQIACDDLGLRYLERETRGLKDIRGLDITYELFAHVFMGNVLYGILTEASTFARPLRLNDRATVFAAFAKLEGAFMIHGGIIDDQRIVMDEKGRVRMQDICDLKYYAPHQRKQLEKDAQNITGVHSRRTPSPERLLLISFRLGCDLRTPPAHDEKNNRRRKQSSKTTRGNLKTLNIGAMPLGPKQSSKALIMLSNTSRNIEPEAPPSYTEFPLPYARIAYRLLMLAPEQEDTFSSASIVEVD
ncbi:hypothetical protein B0H19DRAFT_1294182 [Mycena capillaripes]|nr:hypothetical protein B0H19DRAFT_1294182 [Mycena capillaripes]